MGTVLTSVVYQMEAKTAQTFLLIATVCVLIASFIPLIILGSNGWLSEGTPTVTKTVVATNKAPEAIGPYSQGVFGGDLLFTAGQIALNSRGDIVSDDVGEQTDQVLKNIEAILEEAGLTFSDVIKTTVMLTDIDDYAAVNDVYATYFPYPAPARSAFQVVKLPKAEAKVEIETVAVKQKNE